MEVVLHMVNAPKHLEHCGFGAKAVPEHLLQKRSVQAIKGLFEVKGGCHQVDLTHFAAVLNLSRQGESVSGGSPWEKAKLRGKNGALDVLLYPPVKGLRIGLGYRGHETNVPKALGSRGLLTRLFYPHEAVLGPFERVFPVSRILEDWDQRGRQFSR
jgi:hypothetical protein